jgi:methyltransferase (TIGR00027 family)
MKKEFSRTAEGMALIRAMEQAVAVERRIVDDPYASIFVQHWYLRAIARSALLSRVVLALLERWAPGGQEFLAIRARLTDGEASEFVRHGGRQIVLLGAGFESFALRLREVLSEATVYEVDHPATQNVKREVLRKVAVPGNLKLIPVDFEADDFAKRLIEEGFDPSLRSLIVWVGVTYYLTPKAVESTLQSIARLVCSGSRMIVDFVHADVVDGTSRNTDALEKARRVAALGEPWIFGVAPERIPDYLARFGFAAVKIYGPEELWSRYALGRSKPLDYLTIAVCEKS